ncbi:MAG: MBL fold metallo-hydrolase [Isosphaeraceae bacterium]
MLGVHVIGPGYGESIVIELPDGQVGIIDSFGTRHTGPPTLEFLRARYPKLRKLRFVALTHPHADHCMGMSCYFDAYDVEEFWVFHSFLEHTCMGYFKAMRDKGASDAVEKALGLPAGSIWFEALRIKDAVKEKKGAIAPRFLMAGAHSELCGGRVTARFLTPNDEGKWRYGEILADASAKLMADGPKLNPDWDPSGLPHNQASGAILFEYGDTRILLMADAEDDLWQDLIKEKGDSPLPKAHYIKGAHHGSANGYNSKIYACAADKKTVVVITPFNRHRYPPPTSEGVGHLRPHVKEVLCTNSAEACQSSGLPWKRIAPQPTPALPPEWAVDCRVDTRRLSLLASEQAKHPYVQGSVRIPTRWLHDCQGRPELLQLLCEELRNRKVVGPRPHLNDEFRVSMSYDDKGNVRDRYIGWGVGHLPGV